jgi:hypothetical protein
VRKTADQRIHLWSPSLCISHFHLQPTRPAAVLHGWLPVPLGAASTPATTPSSREPPRCAVENPATARGGFMGARAGLPDSKAIPGEERGEEPSKTAGRS